MDIGAKGPNDQLKQCLAADDPEGYAAMVAREAARCNLTLAEFYVGTLLVDGREARITSPDAQLRARMLEHFALLCRFAATAGFRSIMINPDPVPVGMSEAEAWRLSAEMLAGMVQIARNCAIGFNIEPTPASLLTTPQKAVQMARDVPGLLFTVDYSQYISAGFTQAELEPLHEFLAHMHVCQAKPGAALCGDGDGVISFYRLLEVLFAAGYEGTVAVEYPGAVKPYVMGDNPVRHTLQLAYRIKLLTHEDAFDKYTNFKALFGH